MPFIFPVEGLRSPKFCYINAQIDLCVHCHSYNSKAKERKKERKKKRKKQTSTTKVQYISGYLLLDCLKRMCKYC